MPLNPLETYAHDIDMTYLKVQVDTVLQICNIQIQVLVLLPVSAQIVVLVYSYNTMCKKF